MSQHEQITIDGSEAEERADLRSAADLRRLALHEEQLAEVAELPLVREKHRLAARSWTAMARAVERAERLCGGSDVVLAG